MLGYFSHLTGFPSWIANQVITTPKVSQGPYFPLMPRTVSALGFLVGFNGTTVAKTGTTCNLRALCFILHHCPCWTLPTNLCWLPYSGPYHSVYSHSFLFPTTPNYDWVPTAHHRALLYNMASNVILIVSATRERFFNDT